MTDDKPHDFFGIEDLPVSFSAAKKDVASDFFIPTRTEKTGAAKIKLKFHQDEETDYDRPRKNLQYTDKIRVQGVRNFASPTSIYNSKINLARPRLKTVEFMSKISEEKSYTEIKALQARRDLDRSNLALHNLWSLIPDVYSLTDEDLLDMLLQRIIFNEHDIIAIDKPYGLATVRGPSDKNSITICLDQIRKIIAPKSRQLFPLYSLDKYTTGVLLLASSQLRLSELQDMLTDKSLIRKYWAITKSIPNPPAGIVKIPLAEQNVEGITKMVPVTGEHRNKQSTIAETEYKVLAKSVSCALVETIVSSTDVTDQIWSHLGFGIDCPVLGDHKYSRFQIPPEVIAKMQLRSVNSKRLPTYLHLNEVILPEYKTSQRLVLKADLPKFFALTLKKLRIVLQKI